jgi:hypothetical protein
LGTYDAKDAEVIGEAQAVRKLVNATIDDTSTPSDNAALARIEGVNAQFSLPQSRIIELWND